jgi:cytochrome c-type biogenesis protein CcmE
VIAMRLFVIPAKAGIQFQMKLLASMLAFMLVAGPASAAALSPSTVLLNANQHNGQKIIVSGIVTTFLIKQAPDGTFYETFKLCDANACLQVYALGDTPYTEGAQVSLKGHFWMFVQRGYLTFHNELDIDP